MEQGCDRTDNGSGKDRVPPGTYVGHERTGADGDGEADQDSDDEAGKRRHTRVELKRRPADSEDHASQQRDEAETRRTYETANQEDE